MTDLVQDRPSHVEQEDDFRDTTESSHFVEWLKRSSAIAAPIALTQVILTILLVLDASISINWFLFASGLLYLGGAIYGLIWSVKASAGFGSTGSVHNINLNEKESRAIFIYGLIFAFASVALLVNIRYQGDYSIDMVTAASSDEDLWRDEYDGTLEDYNDWFDGVFTWIAIFQVFFIAYFLYAARVAYRFIGNGYEAMRYIVFLGCFLLFGFSLFLIMGANNIHGYDNYPQLHKLFPVWIENGLFWIALSAAIIAFAGFWIAHRKWRIGFFVLSVALLAWIVLAATFVGYAYRNTSQIYNFYKGLPNQQNICLNRLALVEEDDIQDAGCPAKYLPSSACDYKDRVTRWETDKPKKTTTHEDEEETTTESRLLQSDTERCLNTACCGILGELYSGDYLSLANLGFFAVLSAALVSIGSYYFWYRTHAEVKEHDQHDLIWLILKVIVLLTFLIIFFVAEPDYIDEYTEGGRHLEWSVWGTPAGLEKATYGSWGALPSGPATRDFEIISKSYAPWDAAKTYSYEFISWAGAAPASYQWAESIAAENQYFEWTEYAPSPKGSGKYEYAPSPKGNSKYVGLHYYLSSAAGKLEYAPSPKGNTKYTVTPGPWMYE